MNKCNLKIFFFQDYIKRKENFLLEECQTVSKEYKKSLDDVLCKVNMLVNTKSEEVADLIQILRNGCDDRLGRILNSFKVNSAS